MLFNINHLGKVRVESSVMNAGEHAVSNISSHRAQTHCGVAANRYSHSV